MAEPSGKLLGRAGAALRSARGGRGSAVGALSLCGGIAVGVGSRRGREGGLSVCAPDPGTSAPVHRLIGKPESLYSLPIGHATYMAVVAAASWPLLRWCGRLRLMAVAMAVGWSRIVLGAHFPADVVAGLCAWLGVRGSNGPCQPRAGRRLGPNEGITRVNRFAASRCGPARRSTTSGTRAYVVRRRSIAVHVLCSALAASAFNARAEPAACPPRPTVAGPLSGRATSMAWAEKLPGPCLEALFWHCSDAAGAGILEPADATICSAGYEVLLKTRFGGDFNAFMQWWQMHRNAERGSP